MWSLRVLAATAFVAASALLAQAVVTTDSPSFAAAFRAQEPIITLPSDVVLHEKDFPGVMSISRNILVEGTDPVSYWRLDMNFLQAKARIVNNATVEFRFLNLQNTRYGPSFNLDFFGYSPGATLFLNHSMKEQPACAPADLQKMKSLAPSPGYPADINTRVDLYDSYCMRGVCWKDTLMYHTYAITGTSDGVDGKYDQGGYVIKKEEASKTCIVFTGKCISDGLSVDACVIKAINDYMSARGSSESESSSPPLAAILVPVLVGGTLLVAGVVGLALWLRRRRAAQLESSGASDYYLHKLDPEQCAKPPYPPSSTGPRKPSSNSLNSTPFGKLTSVTTTSSIPTASSAPSAAAHPSEMRSSLESVDSQDDFGYNSGSNLVAHMSRSEAMEKPMPVPEEGLWANSTPSASSSHGTFIKGFDDQGHKFWVEIIGNPVGAGSFGRVYRGKYLNQIVAVKQIEHPVRVALKVESEIALALEFKHRNVVAALQYISKTTTETFSRGAVHRRGAAMAASKQSRSSHETPVDSALMLTGASSGTYPLPAAGAAPDTVPARSSDNSSARESQQTPSGSSSHDKAQGEGPQEAGAAGSDAGGARRTQSSNPCSSGNMHNTADASALASGMQGSEGTPYSRPGCADSAASHNAKVGESKMSTWIVMEWCDNGTLLHAMKDGMFVKDGKPQMLNILLRLLDIASGMAHIHSRGAVHADLKCSNVMLGCSMMDPFGVVAKVCDFGMSRALLEGETYLSTKTMGTVTHQPPELLKTGRLSSACDIYAFGIMCWEIFCGVAAHKRMTFGQVVEGVVCRNMRPLWPPYAPAQYIALAQECWGPDPTKRPPFVDVVCRLTALLPRAAQLQAEVDKLYAAAGAAPATPDVSTPADSSAPSAPSAAAPAVVHPAGLPASPRVSGYGGGGAGHDDEDDDNKILKDDEIDRMVQQEAVAVGK